MLSNYKGSYTGAGQTVVIIDTGASSNYTNSNVVYSYDFADGDSDAINSGMDHGGMVANVTQQVASGVNIIHLKVFKDGEKYTFDSQIEQALQWVVTNLKNYNIAAVNLSLGSGNVQSPTTWAGSDEYEALDDAGIIVTVASGNSAEYYNVDGVNSLSSSESVFSVSAVNSQHKFTDFSQQHKHITDIAALGKDVSVINDNGVLYNVSGTSFSAPIIAATAALVQQAAMDLLGHKITDEQFMDLIQKTGDKITVHNSKTGTYTVTSDSNPFSYALAEANDGSIANAQILGILTDTKAISDSVDKITDNQDFYQFELTETGKVDFLLSNLSADIDLNLYAGDGTLLKNGWDWGSVDIGYSEVLDTGTYYVEVDYYDGTNLKDNSTYNLSLTLGDTPPTKPSPEPTPDPESGDGSIANAQILGILTDTKAISDSVDKITDNQDFYQFELTETGKVDFLLSNLSADIDLNLYAGDGTLLKNGWDWGSVDIGYSEVLDTGTYYVEVDYYDGTNLKDNSTYNLSLTLGDTPSPEPTPLGYTEVNIENAIAYFIDNHDDYAQI